MPRASSTPCESGGIGRRPGFRFQCRKACGFESRLSHHAAACAADHASAADRRALATLRPVIGETTLPFRWPAKRLRRARPSRSCDQDHQHRAAADRRGGRSGYASFGRIARQPRTPHDLQPPGGPPGEPRSVAACARLRAAPSIKGFRPGKVPAKVIEQRFGQQVRAEVLDGLLREGFEQRRARAIAAASPATRRSSRRGADGELSYVATFEVVPDFGDIDVAKLNVVRHTAEVGDADIDAMIENLRLQRRTWNAGGARSAATGDAVDDRDLVAGRRRAPAGRRRRARRHRRSVPARCSRRSSRRWSA